MGERVATHLRYVYECGRDDTSMPNRPEYPRPVCFCGKDTMAVAAFSETTYTYPDGLLAARPSAEGETHE